MDGLENLSRLVIGIQPKLRRESTCKRGFLFLNNFSAHSLAVEGCEDDLSNLCVEWLAPNCRSLVLPVDQGIGNALKIRT